MEKILLRPSDYNNGNPDCLTHKQIRVLNVIRGESKVLSDNAMESLCARTDLSLEIINYIKETVPLIIHFNPILLDKFAEDTHYRSIFEIGRSGGSNNLSARKNAEKIMFLGLYDKYEGFDRPKYGTINTTLDPKGVTTAIPYGKWYFTLHDHVRRRCTMTLSDSFVTNNNPCGNFDFCAHIINKMSDGELRAIERILQNVSPFESITIPYHEVQIHGALSFDLDIKSMHICNKDTDMHAKAYEFAQKNNINVELF